MSDVREKVADVCAWCLYHNEHKFMANPAEHAADSILAIIREALLSDAAVDIASKAMFFHDAMADVEDGEAVTILYTYDDLNDDEKNLFRLAYRAGLISSMDAAGITEADDDDA